MTVWDCPAAESTCRYLLYWEYGANDDTRFTCVCLQDAKTSLRLKPRQNHHDEALLLPPKITTNTVKVLSSLPDVTAGFRLSLGRLQRLDSEPGGSRDGLNPKREGLSSDAIS